MSPASRASAIGLLALALGPPAPAPTQAPPGPRRTDRYGDPLPAGAVFRLGALRLQHPQAISQIAFAAGNRLATATCRIAGLARSPDPCFRLWDRGTGKQLPRPEAEWRGECDFFAVSPAGDAVAMADWSSAAVYDLPTGKQRYRLHDEPSHLAFSADGKVLTGFKTDGNDRAWVAQWDAAGGQRLRRWELPGEAPRGLAQAGRLLVTTGWRASTRRNRSPPGRPTGG